MKLSMTLEVIVGHICLKSTFSYIFFIQNLVLQKLYMNANIMKNQLFHKIKYDLKGFYV